MYFEVIRQYVTFTSIPLYIYIYIYILVVPQKRRCQLGRRINWDSFFFSEDFRWLYFNENSLAHGRYARCFLFSCKSRIFKAIVFFFSFYCSGKKKHPIEVLPDFNNNVSYRKKLKVFFQSFISVREFM